MSDPHEADPREADHREAAPDRLPMTPEEEFRDEEYLDDDPPDFELPPAPFAIAQHGADEAWARQRVINARANGSLDARAPIATIGTRRLGPRNRQVNFRVDEQGYEELTQAAQVLGLRPAGLAAVLVRDGVARVLREHARSFRIGPGPGYGPLT